MRTVCLELMPERDGGWILRSANDGMASSHFLSRREAEAEAAAYLVRNGADGELLVYGADGRVQEAKRWSSNSL